MQLKTFELTALFKQTRQMPFLYVLKFYNCFLGDTEMLFTFDNFNCNILFESVMFVRLQPLNPSLLCSLTSEDQGSREPMFD